MPSTAGPNDASLTKFITALNAAAASGEPTPAQLVSTYFNSNATVGLTDYAPTPLGPVFSGQADITALFKQLFSAFPNFQFVENTNAPCVRLYSADANQTQIAVQATMTGTQHGSWFAAGSTHYSQPISDIKPGKKDMKIPVCAVFLFDNKNMILSLSLFFDRYRMQQQLK
jgi:hypothetical protein